MNTKGLQQMRLVQGNISKVMEAIKCAGARKSMAAAVMRQNRLIYESYKADKEHMSRRAASAVKGDIEAAVRLDFEGKSNAEIAAELNIKPATLSRWRNNYAPVWREAYERLLESESIIRDACVVRIHKRLAEIADDLIENHLHLATSGSENVMRSANKDLLDMLVGKGRSRRLEKPAVQPPADFYSDMASERADTEGTVVEEAN
jgi:hypothetical protein